MQRCMQDIPHENNLAQKEPNINLHFSLQTDQHTVEPQVGFVVFVEPGSVVVETEAGEEYYTVVGQSDEDEDSKRSRHQPLRHIRVYRSKVF